MKCAPVAHAALLLLALLLASGPLQAGNPAFQAGIKAYQQGNYRTALQAFEQARAQGLHSDSLHYNLGSTHYRLGHYEAARQHFALLAAKPQWQALAHYNLGLIAQKQDQPQTAIEHYRLAASRGDPKLGALANLALQKLLGQQSLRRQVFARLGLGHDSNVRQSPEETGSDQDDAFLEALLHGRQRLTPHWHLSGSAYLRHFQHLDTYQQGWLSLGLLHELRGWEQGLHLDLQTLDGKAYQSGLRLGSRWPYQRSAAQALELVGELAALRGSSDYAYLDGWQARAGLGLYQELGRSQLQLRYQAEFNAREDLRHNEDFISFSPQRHQLSAQWLAPLASRWTQESGISYLHSDFGEHRQNGNTQDRQDETLNLWTSLRYRLGPQWQLGGELRHQHTDSTLSSARYDSTQVSASLEYLSL